MNRSTTLLFLLIAYSFMASAQGKLKFDIHTGGTLSYLHGANTGKSANTDVKLGFSGGIGLELLLKKTLFVQTELNYQNLGGRRDKTLLIPLQGYEKYTFQYINVPLLLKLKIAQSGLGIYLGPQYGYLLNSSLKTSAGYYEETDRLRKSDVSGIIGFEYFIPIFETKQIGLSGRYQSSLIHIDNFNSNDLYIKNRAFTFAIGYRF